MPRNEVLFTHDVTQIRILWTLYIGLWPRCYPQHCP